MNLKTKIGMIIGIPLYSGIMIVIILLASIIWIMAKILNLIGTIDSLEWLFKKTAEKARKLRTKSKEDES